MTNYATVTFVDGTEVKLFFKQDSSSETDWIFYNCVQYFNMTLTKSDTMYFSKAHVRSVQIQEDQRMSAYLLRKFPEACAYFDEVDVEIVDHIGDINIL